MAAVMEQLPSSVANLAFMMEFLGRLQHIPLVERIGLTRGVDLLHMWILFRTEEEWAMREAINAERDFLAASGPIPIDFHLYPLDEVSLENLPEIMTVFERA
jgi:hypothetical protein